MTFDKFPLWRPPSAYHNSAWHRARKYPNHEAMKQDVLSFLRTRPIACLREGALVERFVEGEYPFTRNGQIIAYADAIEINHIDFVKTVNVFEIKPVIETVEGIIRQAKSYLYLAAECIESQFQFCHVVVPASDPKLLDLRTEWPLTWAWGFSIEDEIED